MVTTATKARKTTRPRVSVEERKQQAEALHEQIAMQVEQLRDTGAWERFLAFSSAFHTYSLSNVLLLLQQCPEASQVAGFRKWLTLGRAVRKGERGLRIIGYSTKKGTRLNDDGEEEETRSPRFPILSVFDVSQTDVVDAELAAAGELTQRIEGTDDHGIIAALTGHLEREGWSVKREPMPGRKNGYARPSDRSVAIRADLSPAQAAKTLIHETAHILAGHVEDLDDYAEHRGRAETEAESVAYVVAGMLGLDTAAYSIGYIAGWADADSALIRSTAAVVLRVAHQIHDILNPAPKEKLSEE
ncbi:ArdC-like ssDNA-binding domain-containing protein [Cnuibacter physcomitrellae]|uniref:ArdC-like ssDNA-binding domain-containing protein n=1 Tax=Cnuibacter physcomitrellae TaxID=1619308 RepID=UPI00166913E2|nr:ArdC-like ssDNA-binding domain-containing protein [Cnuibacter physcomitrellae]